MSKRPDPSLAAWCAALAEPLAAAESVPAGWQTAREIAAAAGKSLSVTTDHLRHLEAAGRAERRPFRVVTGRGVYPVPHYRLLAK